MEKDTWTSDRVNGVWDLCRNYADKIKEIAKDDKGSLEIPELTDKYLHGVEGLLSIPLKVNQIYSANYSLLKVLSDFPAIKLRLLHCQVQTVREIENSTGHDMDMISDLEQEIRDLERGLQMTNETS